MVSGLPCMCPHPAIYVSSYYYICVLIPLYTHVSLISKMLSVCHGGVHEYTDIKKKITRSTSAKVQILVASEGDVRVCLDQTSALELNLCSD